MHDSQEAATRREVVRTLLTRKMWWANQGTIRAYVYLEDGYHKHHNILAHFLGDCRERMVLDVGCGTAGLCVALARKGVRVIGLDLFADIESADPQIARARAACYDVPLLLCCGKAQSLPFEADIFDAVVSIGMLEHILDKATRAEIIKEAMRVLKPGGIFFITAHPNRFVPYDMHFGFLPFVNWLPRTLRKRYVSLFKPSHIGTVENTANVSTRELARYLNGVSDNIVNVWPQMAIPTNLDHRGKGISFLNLLSRMFRRLRLESLAYQLARLMTWTSTEIVVSLVARKPINIP